MPYVPGFACINFSTAQLKRLSLRHSSWLTFTCLKGCRQKKILLDRNQLLSEYQDEELLRLPAV